jgi:hypothetical protein
VEDWKLFDLGYTNQVQNVFDGEIKYFWGVLKGDFDLWLEFGGGNEFIEEKTELYIHHIRQIFSHLSPSSS